VEAGGGVEDLSFLNGCSACKLTKRIGLFTKEQGGTVCDICYDQVPISTHLLRASNKPYNRKTKNLL
jgi:hypothetical protein